MDPCCAEVQGATHLHLEQATVHLGCKAFQLLRSAKTPLALLTYTVVSLQYPVLADAVLQRGTVGGKVFGHPPDHNLEDS